MRNREQQSYHIYYTLFWQVLGFAVPFTSLSKLCQNAQPKPFCWAKTACFNFYSSNFNLQIHTLSTTGAAWRHQKWQSSNSREMAFQPKTQKTNIRCFKTLNEKAPCVSVSFTEGILTSWIFLWVLKKDSQHAMLATMRAERKNRPIWFVGNICDGDGVYCSISEEGIGSLQSCKTIAGSVDWDQHHPSPEQHWQKHLQPAHHEQYHVAASTPWPTRSWGHLRARKKEKNGTYPSRKMRRKTAESRPTSWINSSSGMRKVMTTQSMTWA